ncbi:hypothetical protein CDAR_368181 [Caerostris darwini]|uniref:Uncharacterized protein n=1 Tax=Caerostris darwini TaxID=1538125 RepID=A0AAV4WHB9_9ARAC|nr:hypothetical protein CDAR_368181 [Caerostris darwini]
MYKVSLLTLWAITIALILTSVVYGQDEAAAATPAEGGDAPAEGGAAPAEGAASGGSCQHDFKSTFAMHGSLIFLMMSYISTYIFCS